MTIHDMTGSFVCTKQAQAPQLPQEFVAEVPIECKPVSFQDGLFTHYFYTVIDRFVGQMKRCFSTDARVVLSGVLALSPKHESLQPLVQFHRLAEENLTADLLH